MQEEVKSLRTMREFLVWYEKNYLDIKPQELSLQLNEFYIKFKYLIKQEDESNEYLKNFLG
ncbi:MAG: hypothetical protein EB000_04950 [Alphaproteobacteria bacterium]|jgi:hypothetical protein|nr:hypothetical protein [Alphaproteobacteria bacterium]